MDQLETVHVLAFSTVCLALTESVSKQTAVI